ncbi:MAG: hypothetical protein IT585_12255 [candidate division Zixibacteria bacterium]|nr:hypothetical protein [candidate division Zixibacteria bacterium]
MALRKLSLSVLVLWLTLASVLAAETLITKENSPANRSNVTSGAGASGFSLFDPSRLHMQHAYTVSVFSGGGRSQTIAAYLNQIDYQFAKPLRLSVGLAFVHQPQSWFGSSASSSLNNRILPSFRLLWEPSKNFHMSINYESYVPGLYNYNGYYSPYGRYGSFFD